MISIRAILALAMALVLHGAGTALAQQPTGDAAKGYTDFQNAIPQRAIAISPDGKSSAWWSGMAGRDPGNAVDNVMGAAAPSAPSPTASSIR